MVTHRRRFDVSHIHLKQGDMRDADARRDGYKKKCSQQGAQNKFVFFMMRRNSSSLTSPSPSRSASSIISWSSSSVMRSPSSLATRLRFLNEILPVSSSSNRRKAFKISSLGSRFKILCVIILNSSYSIVPLPSSPC